MSDHPDPDPAAKRQYGDNVKSGKDPKGEQQDHDTVDEGPADESIRPAERAPLAPGKVAKGPAKATERQRTKFAEQERTASTGGTLGEGEETEPETR
jgi:hypothetical protein